MIRPVRVYVDGVELTVASLDVEPERLTADEFRLLAVVPEGLRMDRGEMRIEVSEDQYVRLLEHDVFSMEPGKP